MPEPTLSEDIRTPEPSSAANKRVDDFLADLAKLRVNSAPKDRIRCLLGLALMVAGAVTTIVAYVKSATTDNTLIQSDAQVLVVVGLTAALVGSVVFLRYSLSEFLRFWLARALFRRSGERES